MSFDKNLDGKKVVVAQVRSCNSANDRVIDTLSALGLGKIGKKKTHVLNACVWGMLRKVSHLVTVTSIE